MAISVQSSPLSFLYVSNALIANRAEQTGEGQVRLHAAAAAGFHLSHYISGRALIEHLKTLFTTPCIYYIHMFMYIRCRTHYDISPHPYGLTPLSRPSTVHQVQPVDVVYSVARVLSSTLFIIHLGSIHKVRTPGEGRRKRTGEGGSVGQRQSVRTYAAMSGVAGRESRKCRQLVTSFNIMLTPASFNKIFENCILFT